MTVGLNDDMMCKATLEKSGLLDISRSEIDRVTFEKFWEKYEGPDFLFRNKFRCSSTYLKLGLGLM